MAAARASSASRPTKRVSGVGSVLGLIRLGVEPMVTNYPPGLGQKINQVPA